MRFFTLLALILILLPTSTSAMGEEDPLLFMFKLNQLELQIFDGASNPLTWEGYAWLGKDLNKFYLKSEGNNIDGEYEELQTELLYSRAITPYWDLQLGERYDSYPKPSRSWLSLGIQGIAPYFFETEATLYVGSNGRTAARLHTEYELMLTQRWILKPDIEINLHSKDDPETRIGSGLSDLSAGLRLRYEIRREFAPYVGVQWGKNFGKTADYAEGHGQDTQFVIGVQVWF